MSEKIVLVGTGGHAKSLIDVIELENKFEIFGLVDNAKNGVIIEQNSLIAMASRVKLGGGSTKK